MRTLGGGGGSGTRLRYGSCHKSHWHCMHRCVAPQAAHRNSRASSRRTPSPEDPERLMCSTPIEEWMTSRKTALSDDKQQPTRDARRSTGRSAAKTQARSDAASPQRPQKPANERERPQNDDRRQKECTTCPALRSPKRGRILAGNYLATGTGKCDGTNDQRWRGHCSLGD